MSTQAITASVGNGRMSKTFSVTATDETWNQNILVDDLGGNPLGILMPGTVINHVAVNYAGGACAWRIIDAVSLQVKRQGWGSLDTYSDYRECLIAPYTIMKTDTLQCFPIKVNGTAARTNVLAWVTSNSGTELYNVNTVVDSTATSIVSAINLQSIGDSLFGQTISAISVQCQDDALLDEITFTDSAGGIIYTAFGTFRGKTAGARSTYHNINLRGLGIAVGKGFLLKVTTVK